jgi:hypothetical protein
MEPGFNIQHHKRKMQTKPNKRKTKQKEIGEIQKSVGNKNHTPK